MTKAVIVAAKRTAIGNFMGTLKGERADKLGAHVIKAVLGDTDIAPSDIDQVIMGQVLTAAQGQNPARQAAVHAGIPHDKTALTINQVCGSGLRSVALAAAAVITGESDIVVAGGQENMSQARHAVDMRGAAKFGDANMQDTMIVDGLWDAFNDYHMGITAENIAEKFDISREDQDAFSATSQQRAEAAINGGKFKDEIVPYVIKHRKGDITFDTDEFPRAGSTAEGLGKLRPAFKRDGGTVTAGNASGLNDGAAAVVVMSEEEARKRGLAILATIESYATRGVDPSIMGTGPIPSSRAAIDKAGWSIEDLDLIESNEAFAAQACSVVKELNLNTDIVNVNGGAIALGHPIGASGTRCLVTLLHEMSKRDAKKGLVTLCIGGGMGIAMCVSR